ncbi:MAG: YpiB family protein [Clostridia bacterium]|nr:YpiB family protein [Clostridia bacterium]
MNVKILQNRRLISKYLRDYCPKDFRGQRVLELLLSCDFLLDRVQLVENIRYMPNAILVSAEGSQTFPFLCRLYDRYYDNIDEIRAILLNNPPEQIFLWLSVDKELTCGLCGENLLVTSDAQAFVLLKRFTRVLQEELEAEALRKERVKHELMCRIDKALSAGDRELFGKLAEKYKKVAGD